MERPKANYKCKPCKDTGWVLYEKPAPSPPYKEGTFLEYGRQCECTTIKPM